MYLASLQKHYEKKLKEVCEILFSIGLAGAIASGTYLMLDNFGPKKSPVVLKKGDLTAVAQCEDGVLSFKPIQDDSLYCEGDLVRIIEQ